MRFCFSTADKIFFERPGGREEDEGECSLKRKKQKTRKVQYDGNHRKRTSINFYKVLAKQKKKK